MAKRRKKREPVIRHGPQVPVKAPTGLARLRQVLGLSKGVREARVLEDAADRLEALEAERQSIRWWRR